MEFCAGAWSTAKVSKMLDQNRTILWGDVDSEMHSAEDTDLAIAFVSQLLNLELIFSNNSEVRAAAKVFGSRGLHIY